MRKGLVGLLLAPFAVCALAAAFRAVADVAARSGSALPFLAGFFGYPAVYLFLFRPVRLYVLGHELSHALAAWASGAKVLGFSVGDKGGHVDLSYSNAFIALAPYVVPVYALGAAAGYRVLLWAAPAWATAGSRTAFLAVMGACLSFHLLHTAEALWTVRQPDLRHAGGALFSLSFIALANGLALALLLKCLFPASVSLARVWGSAWGWSAAFWGLLLRVASWALSLLWGRARPAASAS